MIAEMLNDRVLIEPHVNPDTSESGIYTGRIKTGFTTGYRNANPGGMAEQITTGRVVSVGPGKLSKKNVRLPTGLKPGDYVAFSDSCHRPAGIEDFIVIRSDDVMLVSDQPISSCEILN